MAFSIFPIIYINTLKNDIQSFLPKDIKKFKNLSEKAVSYGLRKFVGVLEDTGVKIYFQYAPEFIKEGIEISPFKLPLQSGVLEGDS